MNFRRAVWKELCLCISLQIFCFEKFFVMIKRMYNVFCSKEIVNIADYFIDEREIPKQRDDTSRLSVMIKVIFSC